MARTTKQIAADVIADSYDTATGEPVNRASVLFHSHATAWPEARGMNRGQRSALVDQVSAEVQRQS